MKKLFGAAFALLLLQTGNSALVPNEMTKNFECYTSSDCVGDLICVTG